MAPSDGGESAPRRARPSKACAPCGAHKVKCEWTAGNAACDRCLRLSKSCEPQSSALSRRQRERLRKVEKWKAMLAEMAGGAAPDNAKGSPSSSDSPTSSGRPALSGSAGLVELWSGRKSSPGSDTDPLTSSDPLPTDSRSPVDLLPFGRNHSNSSYAHSGNSPVSQSSWIAAGAPLFSASFGLPDNPEQAMRVSVHAPPVFGQLPAPLHGAENVAMAAWERAFSVPQQVSLAPPEGGFLIAAHALYRFLPSSCFLARFILWCHPVSECAAPYPEILLLCLSSYWENFHPFVPMVHRPTLEAAFAGRGSAIYGERPPLALLYAAAGCGAFMVRTGALSEPEKMRIGIAYCERARDLLLAGYFGSPQAAARPVTDMEASQALWQLLEALLSVGMVGKAAPLMRHGISILARLAAAGPDLRGRNDCLSPAWIPANVEQWLRGELVLRLWVAYANLDVVFAHHTNREPSFDWFPRRPIRLACHELYWTHPDPAAAFDLVFVSGDGRFLPTSANFGEFFAGGYRLEDGQRLMRDVVRPVFELRAGTYAVLHLNSFFRLLRLRIRDDAKRTGVEPMATIARPAEQWTPAEAAFRARVQIFDAVVAEVFASMPPEIGAGLAQGDAGPLMASWPTYFADPMHALMLITTVMPLHAYPIEHFMGHGKPEGAQASLFSSPEFLRVLDSAVLYVRLMGSQMDHDPELRSPHFMRTYETFMAAAINFAGIGILRSANTPPAAVASSGFANDLRTIARHMDAVGRNFGLMYQRSAARFRKSMLDAGVRPDPTLLPAPEEEEGGAGPNVPGPPVFVGPGESLKGGAGEPGRTVAELVQATDRRASAWVS
ncbi:hypothetical protein DFJ74DRAFT_143174 [Hyaloraphidium curvatum]|nr:hypothetical protein DFJ74DRAFT_143174 [Hyaloraphidium curvatum]